MTASELEINELEENDFSSNYGKEFKKLISSKKQNETNILNQESEYLEKYVEELEKFVEETFEPNNLNHLKNQEANYPIFETNPNSVKEKVLKPNIKNKKVNILKLKEKNCILGNVLFQII